MTFKDCEAKKASGGAIYASSAVSITGAGSTSFNGCTASSSGGAIYADGAVSITGTGSTSFTSCTASTSGGAIYSGNALTVTGTDSNYVTFESCHSSGSGGAIYHKSGALSLDYVRFGKRNGTAVVKDDIYGTRGGAV